MQVSCFIIFHLTISICSEINILPLFIEIVKNITLLHIFDISILSRKETYQLPLLAYSVANRGGKRKKHKVMQWEQIKKKKEKEGKAKKTGR